MKKLNFFGKLIYGLNIIVALFLLVSFIIPFLPPKSFPMMSVLSLAVSPLILANIIFMMYWLIQLKKQFWLSFLIVLCSLFCFNPFYEISKKGDASQHNKTLSVLSYNVRLFNAYEDNPSQEKIAKNVSKLLSTEAPDIIFFQEYYKDYTLKFEDYPYRHIHFRGNKNKLGHAIFSKYPLINKGEIGFDNSYNNSIFADVVAYNDTIRLYNLHLQSLGILPSVSYVQSRGAETIQKRISETFVEQEKQVIKILNHKEKSPYPILLAGDFNNTSFSYVYRKLKQDMSDAFLERGNGLGTTFKFNNYPMRIDYILASPSLKIIDFKTLEESFSDHYPIATQLGWE